MRFSLITAFLITFSACCDGDAQQLANEFITRDGGDVETALCGPEDRGVECKYKDGRGRVVEIDCTSCGCQKDID